MIKLSAVIITHNEEKNIERCLLSAMRLADEVIVLDSFSTDQTVVICNKYPSVKLIQRKWEGYALSKNYANSLATNEMILSLDADEEISVELENEIRATPLSSDTVYHFKRLTNYCGKWIHYCGWYPDSKVRIFSKYNAFWEGNFVHEVLAFKTDLKQVTFNGNLFHYSYYTISEHKQRIVKYANLHAQQLKAEGKFFSVFKWLLSPVFKFFKTYFIQLGFLDGYYGLVISLVSARYVFLKYSILKQIS
jgi:glycosyltransferase involved in cell wall biosynthesis